MGKYMLSLRPSGTARKNKKKCLFSLEIKFVDVQFQPGWIILNCQEKWVKILISLHSRTSRKQMISHSSLLSHFYFLKFCLWISANLAFFEANVGKFGLQFIVPVLSKSSSLKFFHNVSQFLTQSSGCVICILIVSWITVK